MIEVTNISKSFGKKQKKVLDNVSLKVNQGEILCLLGPSGSGKTTLIRLILGALKIDAGEIYVNSIKSPSMDIYKDVGYMPQEDALYIDLSGIDNLLFFGRLYNIKKEQLEERVDEVLKLLNLFEDKDKLVSNYSGGMKKRLSLAIALLHKPKILLLDEPTVGIDPILRKAIWEELYDLRAQGTCIVISTHVMDEASKCNGSALIYNGKLIYNDSTDALLAKTKSGNIEELFFVAEEGKDGCLFSQRCNSNFARKNGQRRDHRSGGTSVSHNIWRTESVNIAGRIIKQMLHDKRSLAMIIVVPLLLITLLYLLLGKSDYTPKIALENMSSKMVSQLEKQEDIKIVSTDENFNHKEYIKDGKLML